MHKCGVVVELLVQILCDLVPTLNVTNCRKQPLKKVKVELRHQIFCEKTMQQVNIQSLIWKNSCICDVRHPRYTYFFHEITTFIKVRLAFVFGLQTL